MSDGELTARRVRMGGLVFLLCGAALVWIGVYLLTGIMGWRIGFDATGLSVLWLLVSGMVVIGMGGQMLAFGRRPRGLLWLFVVLVAFFVVAGAIVTLQSGGRLPRLHL